MSNGNKQKKAVRGDTSTAQHLSDPQLAEVVQVVTKFLGEKTLPYNSKQGELITNIGDSYIVMGKEDTTQTNCWNIDLVTGRLGDIGKEIAKDKTLVANKNEYLDAARVYICERSNIDEVFGLDDFYSNPDKNFTEGSSENKSAVAIKADGVRIIARESIKFITMSDETNSTNNTITGKYGIELIGGISINEPNYDLQPIAKAGNVGQAFKFLIDHLAQLDTQISMIDKILIQTIKALSTHAHSLAPPSPLTSPPIDPVSIASNVISCTDLLAQIAEINLRQFNHGTFIKNYLLDGSATYIGSSQNKTT